MSKQQRLGELHEMRRLEETVEAVRDEKAELRQILDNCIQVRREEKEGGRDPRCFESG